MNSYEKLVCDAEKMGLEVIEKHFKSSAKGLCKGKKIGISKTIEQSVEKRCVLAEEIAHSLYTVGNIIDTRNESNYKQELFARKKAYEMILPLYMIIESYRSGNVSCYEMAEDLEVTEEFLVNTILHYNTKYGNSLHYGAWRMSAFPLQIAETEAI